MMISFLQRLALENNKNALNLKIALRQDTVRRPRLWEL